MCREKDDPSSHSPASIMRPWLASNLPYGKSNQITESTDEVGTVCPVDLYSTILRRLIKRSFGVWQRLGFHVSPNHFYEPIPDTRYLSSGLWSRLSDLPGIDLRERDQLALIAEFARDFGP